MARGGKRPGAGRKPAAKPEALPPAPSPEVVAKVAADGITIERTLRELARIGYADLRDVVGWLARPCGIDEETGEIQVCNEVNLIDSAKLPPDVAAAVAEISQSKEGRLKIKMHPKLPALAQLLKHLVGAQKAQKAQAEKPAEQAAPAPAFNRFAPRPPPKPMSH